MYKFPFDIYLLHKKTSEKRQVHFSDVCGLFIKPGIQERGTECGECRERRECSLGFRGMLLFYYSGEC